MSAPLILAFDTSGPHCAVAFCAKGRIMTSACEAMKKGQAERLMGLLAQTLAAQGLGYQDLDALAVGTGPGNFTGIRIGVAAARGLSLGLGIPAYGVTGFEQRAYLFPQRPVHSIPAPMGRRYVFEHGQARMSDPSQGQQSALPEDPGAQDLVEAIALVAAQRWPQKAVAPVPFYVRPPDAAPSKTQKPFLLDNPTPAG